MKKLFTFILVLALLVTTFSSCSLSKNDTVIRIGYMQGPTGMGIAKLIHDNGSVSGNEKYEFVKFEDAQKATAALLSGSIDLACLPTNTAATLYNTKNGAVQALALNCLNSLYLMTKSGSEITSFAELEGKTVYTIANGTPKILLEYLLNELGVSATVKTTATVNGNEKDLVQPSDLAQAMITGSVDIALVPEPVATSAPLQIASQNKEYSYTVSLDLKNVWSQCSDTPIAMGCIVGNTEFIKNNKNAVNSFLNDYKSSIEFISNSANSELAADYIVEAEVLGAAGPAKKSLKNLGDQIAYYDGTAMREILSSFLAVLNPGVIGGKLPDEGFYYEK